jgi:hypothetical protein
MDEKQLFLVQKKDISKWLEDRAMLKTGISIANIDMLKFRKRNKPLKGTVWGALIGGTATGITFAIINELDKPCRGWLCWSNSEVFTMGFIFGSIPGAIIGAIIGQSKIKIRIGGRYDRYVDQKKKIRSYIYDYP